MAQLGCLYNVVFIAFWDGILLHPASAMALAALTGRFFQCIGDFIFSALEILFGILYKVSNIFAEYIYLH